MDDRLDIIVFGATGFTGKYLLIQAYKIFKNISWGVAGRNDEKLRSALKVTAEAVGVSNFKSIPIVLANIEDNATIKKMTAQAKVIINCCGPYSLHGGEVVVAACIETGTHYVDISAEALFMESILLKYARLAEEKGIYVVNACGFDSVPYDLGICYVERNFEGILNSVEVYLHSHRDSGNNEGASINNSTWESVINGMSSFKRLKTIRKQLKEKKIFGFKPKLSIKLPHKFKNGWALIFPGTDTDVVRRTQVYFYENNNKRPVQMHNYVVVNSFWILIVTVLFGILCLIMAQFAFGRKLMFQYPAFFSNGVFSHGSPSEDKLNRTHFSMTLKGKGWSNKTSTANNWKQTDPNKEIVCHISGVNPAYGISSICVAMCAFVMVTEPQNLPSRRGIYTPAVAFSKTSLVEKLNSNGVKFEVLSIKDVK